MFGASYKARDMMVSRPIAKLSSTVLTTLEVKSACSAWLVNHKLPTLADASLNLTTVCVVP